MKLCLFHSFPNVTWIYGTHFNFASWKIVFSGTFDQTFVQMPDYGLSFTWKSWTILVQTEKLDHWDLGLVWPYISFLTLDGNAPPYRGLLVFVPSNLAFNFLPCSVALPAWRQSEFYVYLLTECLLQMNVFKLHQKCLSNNLISFLNLICNSMEKDSLS